MPVITIDPGTRHTGLVYMDSRNILAAKTLSFGRACGVSQDALAERCADIWRRMEDFVLMHHHDAVIIEGFVTFSSPRRQNAFIHQTPFLVGYLAKAMEDENLVFQTSTEAFGKLGRDPNKTSAVRRYAPRNATGLDTLTNEHLRSAACHGWLYYEKEARDAGTL